MNYVYNYIKDNFQSKNGVKFFLYRGTQILDSTKKFARMASFGKCQLGEVPVGKRVSSGQGQKFNLDGPFFFNFVDGRNSTPFPAVNQLRLSEPKT